MDTRPVRLHMTEAVLWTLAVQSTALIGGLLLWRQYAAGIPACIADEVWLCTLYAVRRRRLAGLAGPPPTLVLPALTSTQVLETLVLRKGRGPHVRYVEDAS